jgi:hypothetical protein
LLLCRNSSITGFDPQWVFFYPLGQFILQLADEYDDYLVRQIVDTIRVMDGGKLIITFKGGETTEREVILK